MPTIIVQDAATNTLDRPDHLITAEPDSGIIVRDYEMPFLNFKINVHSRRLSELRKAFSKSIETEEDEYQVMQLLASAAEAGEELIDIMRSFMK